MEKFNIKSTTAREIIDSRGNPTIEACVTLQSGQMGVAAVPSGASTGAFEAFELRDKNNSRYLGKGVLEAVKNVNEKINKALVGKNALNQQEIDKIMTDLDKTPNLKNLGANAVLAVSLANAKACANELGIPLYRYIGGINATILPVPMMNILNGGAHSRNNIDIQEFMIMPVGAENFTEGVRMCAEIFHALGEILNSKGLSTSVGDEGGYAPDLANEVGAIDLILEAVVKAGYEPKKDIMLALDIAASEWRQGDKYIMPKKNKALTQGELIDFIGFLIETYPIFSIEDPLAEDDFEGFSIITNRFGKTVQIVGDDLFVTNKKFLKKGIEQKSGNAILIKLNQIGTLSGTLEAVKLAKSNCYNVIISHRSGETEDTTIADLAVALNAGQIKTGAPSRSDRVAKYNRLLKINDELGACAEYGSFSLTHNPTKK
jgi:enolase